MPAQYVSKIRFDDSGDTPSYLDRLPVIRHLRQAGELSFSKNVTFFVGENGSGKSTLLEAIAIACGFNAEGGTRNFRFTTRATHSALWRQIHVIRRDYAPDGFFLRAESLYNTATYIDEVQAVGSYGGISLHDQSHGESFLAIVENRFRPDGLYFLDEPEAALSPMRQLTFLSELHDLAKAGAQFLIATHSPILMACPDAEILYFSEDGITPTAYRDTPHYQLTRQFLDNPDRMLHYLLDASD